MVASRSGEQITAPPAASEASEEEEANPIRSSKGEQRTFAPHHHRHDGRQNERPIWRRYSTITSRRASYTLMAINVHLDR
ncbi:hypothetical protein OUZ56_020352 [Daphnia magna]|uniref:Uncharacterized protein n=1 Tax=Daphnia magna TaxID=35525 RepID=A0ABQ9ZEI5_9CRUS|nr:hypothetical protein OUZ56_020352 [Daphnia magna]